MLIRSILVLLVFYLTGSVFAVENKEGYGLPFPRVMALAIKAPTNYDNPEYQRQLSRADVIILNFWPEWKEYKYGKDSMRNIVKKIKSLNPKILVGQYTILGEAQDSSVEDKTNLDRSLKIEKENWWLRGIDGDKVQWTNRYRAWDINFTEFSTPDKEGMKYPQWLANRNYETFFKKVPELDFWYLDNTLNESPIKIAYWRRNTLPDFSSAPNVAKAYREGHVSYWDAIKEVQPMTLLIANARDLSSAEYSGRLDGAVIEAAIGRQWSIYERHGWLRLLKHYYAFLDDVKAPGIVGFNVWGRRDDFKKMRFGLATCLLGGGYFSYTDEEVGYSTLPWFDEYSVNLGYPVSPATVLPWKNGVYRRDYENGIVLVNPTESVQKIELEGWYRRMLGVQAPNVNDGALVKHISIDSKDGLILMRR